MNLNRLKTLTSGSFSFFVITKLYLFLMDKPQEVSLHAAGNENLNAAPHTVIRLCLVIYLLPLSMLQSTKQLLVVLFLQVILVNLDGNSPVLSNTTLILPLPPSQTTFGPVDVISLLKMANTRLQILVCTLHTYSIIITDVIEFVRNTDLNIILVNDKERNVPS